jgi:hypothetical protein
MKDDSVVIVRINLLKAESVVNKLNKNSSGKINEKGGRC